MEEFKIKGDQLVQKIKDLIHQGNIRSITIKDKNGNVILSIPVTIGVIGAVIAPVLAAVGGIAALMTECTIVVEKKRTQINNWTWNIVHV